jgi:hypothetical protein
VSAKIGQLKMITPDGKSREIDCANGESIHEDKDFAILTVEISKTAFALTLKEYKNFIRRLRPYALF